MSNPTWFLAVTLLAGQLDAASLRSTFSANPAAIDYQKSSETPAGFDAQGREIRLRAVLDTNVPCPRYESWRTGQCSKPAGNLLAFKLKAPLNGGTLIACAETHGTTFKTGAAAANSLLVVPLDGAVDSMVFESVALQPSLNNRFLMLDPTKEAAVQDMCFALNGIYHFPKRWYDLAPAARVAASDTTWLNQAEKEWLDASGLNDSRADRGWRGRAANGACEAVLAWDKPVKVEAVGAYFSHGNFGNMPVAVEILGKTTGEWRPLAKLDGFDNNIHLGRKMYLFEVPPVEVQELKFVFKARGQFVEAAELFVLGPEAVAAVPMEQAAAPVSFPVALPRSGDVSLVIEDARGKRIRNLVANQAVKVEMEPFFLGLFERREPVVFAWDGLDEAGKVVEPGAYRYRGLVHDPIRALYELSAYNPGDPPWTSSNFRGGWLSDHCAPSALLSLDSELWVGAPMAEAGSALMRLDLQGRKQWGTRWLDLAGAEHLAADGGALYVASAGGWRGSQLSVTRLDRETHDFKRLLDLKGAAEGWGKSQELGGFAVDSGKAYLSFTAQDKIKVYSLADGNLEREIAVDSPRAALVKDGKLYVISGKKLKRLEPAADVVSSGLEEPANFAIAPDGTFYVCDRQAGQVKRFAADGRFLGAIGKGGARRAGLFDPLILDRPTAVAVTPANEVWIAEDSQQPKRLSVWTAGGKLLREFVGNGQYACGGSLDPDDASRYFAEGMEFALDYKTGTSQLKSVNFLERAPSFFTNPGESFDELPDRALRSHGRLFLVQDHYWARPFFWIGVMDEATHVLRPCAAVGNYKQKKDVTFLWNDDNRDGQVQDAELRFRPGAFIPLNWGCHVDSDLAFLWFDEGDGQLKRLPPAAWDADGLPRYDFKNLEPAGSFGKWDYVAAHRFDAKHLLLNGNPLRCVDPASGSTRWTYPNPFPSNGHDSPLPKPGELQHTLQVEGSVDLGGDIGQIFSLNSNKGWRHLLTLDGLYVAPVFRDMRLASSISFANQARPGMDMAGYSLDDEAFDGSFQRCSDGAIRMICGKNHHSVFRIEGLESVERFEGDLSVSAEQTAAAAADLIRRKELERQRQIVRPIIVTRRGDKPEPVSIENVCELKLSHDATTLYLTARVKDKTPFVNGGDDWRMLFKTGDSFNLELGCQRTNLADKRPVPGDVRLLFAPFKGKPICVAYRYKTEPPAARPVAFSSPWAETLVDQVEILENAELKVTRSGDGYVLEAALPLGPLKGKRFGDFGVIFSDDSGTRNAYSVFFASPAKGVTADVPSEIRLRPEFWREIEIK